jgi:hypothetical protein
MDYLTGVQTLARLAGITNATLPTSVTGQEGGLLKAVKYYDMAHEEIQNMFFDWDFLWATNTITTVQSTEVYAGAADIGIWDTKRIFYDGERLEVIPYADYVPETLSENTPEEVVIQPNNQLKVIPPPAGAYTITYDYFVKPKVLVANSDVPLIPLQFRMVIVGRALMLYANFESAEEAKIQGEELYSVYMDALKKHQLSRRQQFHGRQEAVDFTVITE